MRNAGHIALPEGTIGINHRQQRRGQQQSPEAEHQAEHDRDYQGRPDGNTHCTLHNEGLQDQAVDHNNRSIQDQHIDHSHEAVGDKRGYGGPEERDHRTELRDELEQGCQYSPEWRPRHVQEKQAGPPQKSDTEGVVALRHKPTAKRTSGDADVTGKLHVSFDATPQEAVAKPMLNLTHTDSGDGAVMKFGVIIFPGSNCDHDAFWVISEVAKQPVTFLWHDSKDLQGCDAIVVPGGFAYGDYLRTGAIAKFSPVMESVRKFAADGGPVLGICNGFQILCEAGLLPGALLRNAGLKYVCKPVHVRVESTNTPYTQQLTKGDVLEIPIGHMEGNYFCDEKTLAELKDEDRIIFRYVDRAGQRTAEANPNGSLDDIAAICNAGRNVMGMMPHPERASEAELGMTDGARVFHSLVSSMVAK